jgi:hypothetical protein
VFEERWPDKKFSGVSCGAVGFLTGFDHADDVVFDFVNGILGASRQSLACGCNIIQAMLRRTSDVAACFLSGGWRKKQCNERADAGSHDKCCERVRPIIGSVFAGRRWLGIFPLAQKLALASCEKETQGEGHPADNSLLFLLSSSQTEMWAGTPYDCHPRERQSGDWRSRESRVPTPAYVLSPVLSNQMRTWKPRGDFAWRKRRMTSLALSSMGALTR